MDRYAGVVDHLERVAPTIVELVGPHYEISASADGTATVISGERPRFNAEVNADGRLVITVIPDSEGPL